MQLPLEELEEWLEHFPTRNQKAIDRLAASLFVNCRFPGHRMIASFTAYFDASGNALDQPFVIVAGYIANYAQWKNLEEMWDQVHKRHNVDLPFHMAEFEAALQNPSRYATQKKARADYIALGNDPKRADLFLTNLMLAQVSLVNCSVTAIVPMSIYNGISSLLDLREVIPPYALGARMCLAQVNQWEKLFDLHEPVECIFEEGDFEQGKFTELMMSDGGSVPIYKPKDKYAGLQAADLYAWERAKYEKHKMSQPDVPSPRESFHYLLGGIPTMHLQTTAAQLINLCHSRGIDPKTGVRHDKS